MDRLKRGHFPAALNGRVFLSQFGAWTALRGKEGEIPAAEKPDDPATAVRC